MFNIFKNDLKTISKNIPLLFVILGLCFLPSLYAWFNIKASWDPYSNTKNLSVAVVNKDKSVKFRDKEINFGDEVINKLKENDKLGWKFTNEKEALDGIKTGKYYALIEIPENFSEDIISIESNNAKKAKIDYTVNEKLNAIAPKITDKGASTVQTELNQVIVKTVSEIIFEISNEAGIEIENTLPKLNNLENELKTVKEKFENMNQTISLADDSTVKLDTVISDFKSQIPVIKETLNQTKDLTNNMKTFLNESKTSVETTIPIVKNDLQILLDVSTNTSNSVNELLNAINTGQQNAPTYIENVNIKLNSLLKNNQIILEFLTSLKQFDTQNKLDEPINQLTAMQTEIKSAIDMVNNLASQISSASPQVISDLNKLLNVSNEIKTMTSSLLNDFDTKISEPLNQIITKSFDITSKIDKIVDSTSNELPKIENVLNTGQDFSNSAKEDIEFIKEKLPVAQNIVNELTDVIQKINSSEEVSELILSLKNDVSSRSDFLEEPVELVTKRLYPLENYGSGMTPFYTVLSLWVGILLLMSILSTEVKGEFSSNQVYFGRGLTILLIAIIQSLIVSIGDIYILKVSVDSPILFVGLSVFISIVFVSIIYSLVSIFGNVGKALAIIFMVLQVSASGGTFPIEVTPQFFQNINPYLPFTYAIKILRESVSGVYMPNLNKGIIILSMFFVGFIIFSVICKKTINNSSKKVREKLRDNDLIH